MSSKTKEVRQNGCIVVDRDKALEDNKELINRLIGPHNVPAHEPTGGTKHDAGKVPVELLPTQALEEIAKVLDFGKRKYSAWNWSQGFAWSRLIGAAMRHLFAWQRGEDKDPESGLSHLAHAGCCVLFLIQHELSRLGTDDRHKGFVKTAGESK